MNLLIIKKQLKYIYMVGGGKTNLSDHMREF